MRAKLQNLSQTEEKNRIARFFKHKKGTELDQNWIRIRSEFTEF
jgi:hypothetical protein